MIAYVTLGIPTKNSHWSYLLSLTQKQSNEKNIRYLSSISSESEKNVSGCRSFQNIFFAIQYAYHFEYKARCHSGYQITCFEFRYSIQLLCAFLFILFCFALIEFHWLFQAFKWFAPFRKGNYILIEIGLCHQAVSLVLFYLSEQSIY